MSRLSALSGCAVGCIALGVAIVSWSCGSEWSKEATASILVHDREFGMRAVDKAIEYGDAMLPLLRKESNNFRLLDNRNAFWIADVLGAIDTQESRKVLDNLYARQNTLAKLVGAIGLAQRDALPEDIDESSFVVNVVRGTASEDERQLAIIALGKTKNAKALPYLFDILESRGCPYWDHAYACEAVARIRSPDAAPILSACLESGEYYALSEAFRALIAIGDRGAVPLAIRRVSPELKDFNGEFVIDELERVTGQHFGYDRDKWTKWWISVESEWRIPSEFTKPWDEQVGMYE